MYYWGNSITTNQANYNQSGYSQTRDVGSYDPNPWGFYDMHGNIWEWCSDWHEAFSNNIQTDPMGPLSGTNRVARSGSLVNDGANQRSASRNYWIPEGRHKAHGFRIAFQQITTPPTNLNSNAPLTIAENQPVGTDCWRI